MSKIIYYDGLNHLDRKRTKLVAVKLNEPEWVVLSNLKKVLDQHNYSDLIRALMFRAIHTLTDEEQTELREMVKQHPREAIVRTRSDRTPCG